MIDEIKNPWHMRKGVVVFDIETDWGNDFSEEGKKSKVMRCGVLYCYDSDEFNTYYNPIELVDTLNKAKAIVSYNGEGFDFLVLEKYGLKIKKYGNRWKPVGIKSFDIMHTIHQRRSTSEQELKYPKLEELMKQHYDCKKCEYDHENLDELTKHCIEDVKYTRLLYEEKIWKVPIVKRQSKKRRWANYYDDDIGGVIWDGETWINEGSFGQPVGQFSFSDFYHGRVPKDIECPICNKGRISLYPVVAKFRTDEMRCPKCGGLIKFAPGTATVILTMTKDELESNVCPNCHKSLKKSSYDHHGYGAGQGDLSSGRSLCPVCGRGCYKWEDDNTPGFKDHYKGECCHCGKNIDEWYIELHNKKIED